MAVKIGNALGAHVTVLSHSDKKQADAKRLGARDFHNTSTAETFAALARQFDFILDTVSAPHDLNAYLELLKTDGTMILVGAPEKPASAGGVSVDPETATFGGLADRRHQGDPGDARLLRETQVRSGHRSHSHPTDQRRLRPPHPRRRALSLRDRYAIAQTEHVAYRPTTPLQLRAVHFFVAPGEQLSRSLTQHHLGTMHA